MQILPLIQRSSQSAASDAATIGSAGLGSRQSALFASILDSARTTAASTADQPKASSYGTTNEDTSRVDVAEAAAQPSDAELKALPVTREDIAALRDDLKEQGFSDDEISALEDEAGDGQSMTWGDLMGKVEKKVATTEKAEKKTVSNDDQAQLLGLFGKLGFTTEQSQQMIEALSKGETQSVWTAINTKLDTLSGDDSASLAASELNALGRAMNLSDDAQSRLTALFNQSGAAAGLSGQGIVTAMGLLKNELTAQIGKENQALAEFRQASSGVLANAWQREAGKRNSDLHQDDVARKAGQIVAMSSEQGGADTSSGFDALADVPQAGQGVADAATLATAETGQAVHNGRTAETAQTASPAAVTAALAGKAGPVAAEQAALAGETGTATTTQQAAQSDLSRSATDKAAATVASATAGRDTQNFFGGQQGTAGNNFAGQENPEDALAEFMSKIRFGGKTGTTLVGQTADVTATTAAMDAVKTTTANQQAKAIDPALAARVAKQVETGILKGVAQEAKQLTVNLTPDELGPVQVTLSVKDKEVRAVITADNADAAAILQQQTAKIKQQLEDQGFTVSKLDVQTGLTQDNQTAAWDSPERHNEAREQREALERVRSSARLAREAVGFDADSLSAIPGAMTARAAGLDLFA
ncbi:flagellar hook-length control protein FliK [Desulfovibrio aerotolerans]|uniref:Flagellar hook-length control protein FliK n=1 Tax=Solidesulfovibrio aerotolerans TaxID=295255 RepID=A0A7C9NKK9_9BACT|nr:flagellar hook-length control protein FliK [Solidesulfovibrio aerotolerans]MYL84116.1 flagellar hook-length control protein FliK [Solidesulfovibrio aerotolerans]